MNVKRQAAALLLLLAAGILLTQAQAAPGAPAGSVDASDRAGRAQAWNTLLEELADARGRVYRTGRHAGELKETALRLTSAPPRAEAALDSFAACLEELRAVARRQDAAMTVAETRAEAHRMAVSAAASLQGQATRSASGATRVSLSGQTGDGSAQAALALAAQGRHEAERAASAAMRKAAARSQVCEQFDLSPLTGRMFEVYYWARASANLPGQAQATRQAMEDVRQSAGRVAGTAPAARVSGSDSVRRPAGAEPASTTQASVLSQALPPLPPARPDAGHSRDDADMAIAVQPVQGQAALARWGTANHLRFTRWQRLAIVDDAALFVRVAASDPACGNACLSQDAAEQARERTDAVADTQRRLRERDSADADLSRLQSRWRSALHAARQRVIAGDGGIADEVQRWAQATESTARALEEALLAQCAIELQGSPEMQLCTARGFADAETMVAGPPPPVSAVLSELRLHAYTWMNGWDEEPRDFRAYTYVLLRGSLDRQLPEVRQRLARLLVELETLPEAATLAGEQRATANLFILPGMGADPPHQGYDTRLAQALMSRSQGAILLQPAVRGRLLAGPGPFLVTLPVRMSQASGSTPLLLADLSQTPPDAITDLARSYMRGLLDRFPTEQENWRPPTGQVVALWMLRVAASTGQLIETVMPSAAARPTR
ncbi:MAG: hypothetical protein JNJ71_05935 [Rubrivivax sp.]|nr:hypothetical protein [Rubrivivax sp.]